MLLGPQFHCVRTRGVYKLVVVNIWGFRSVATGGRAELHLPVLPQTWGDPFTSPDHSMNGTLGKGPHCPLLGAASASEVGCYPGVDWTLHPGAVQVS